MGRVVHFEIHASNPKALIAFYTGLFAWTITQWADNPYWMVETGAKDQPGIDGGMVQRRGPAPTEGASVNAFVCTVQVDSVDATLSKALALGGTMAVPKMPIPTVGWLAYIKDPDGNIVGLMQSDPNAA